MESLAEFSKGIGYTKNDLTEQGTPVILYGRLYTKYETLINQVDTFVKIKEKSVISEGEEIIVPASGETAGDISRASVVGKAGFVLGGDLNIIKTSQEMDSIFLALTISNGTPKKEMAKRAQGKSVVHLHNSDLKEVSLFYPEINEQKRISKFFERLNKLIALHQRKYDLLLQLKTSLLCFLFPSRRIKIPTIRFVNFNKVWNHNKFANILRVHPFKHYLAKPDSNGKYKIIQQGDNPVIGYTNGNPFQTFEDVTLFGDHTVSLYKPKAPFFVATDGLKILSADGFDGDYLFVTLERYKPKSQGYKRHFTILKNEDVWYTTNHAEQKKIGNFFITIDELATLHHKNIENLIFLKNTFLRKMFV